MHKFAVDFIDKHKDHPFFLYYPMSHMHAPILPLQTARKAKIKISSTPTTSNTWTSWLVS